MNRTLKGGGMMSVSATICPYCGHIFSGTIALYEHLQGEHGVGGFHFVPSDVDVPEGVGMPPPDKKA